MGLSCIGETRILANQLLYEETLWFLGLNSMEYLLLMLGAQKVSRTPIKKSQPLLESIG